jgi:hypothetical protein
MTKKVLNKKTVKSTPDLSPDEEIVALKNKIAKYQEAKRRLDELNKNISDLRVQLYSHLDKVKEKLILEKIVNQKDY